ncbi:hypothetical protein [Roseivirga sp.]|jgi:hypothetical protein|nr:hypothetical protein [Roseivirga sp.]
MKKLLILALLIIGFSACQQEDTELTPEEQYLPSFQSEESELL